MGIMANNDGHTLHAEERVRLGTEQKSCKGFVGTGMTARRRSYGVGHVHDLTLISTFASPFPARRPFLPFTTLQAARFSDSNLDIFF